MPPSSAGEIASAATGDRGGGTWCPRGVRGHHVCTVRKDQCLVEGALAAVTFTADQALFTVLYAVLEAP